MSSTFTTDRFVWPGLLAALLITGCARPAPPPQPAAASVHTIRAGVPGGTTVQTAEVSARVVAVDHKRRTAILLGPDGKEFEVKVGPEAVNFDQVEKGDLVVATLTREWVVAVAPADASLPDVAAGGVALAPEGAAPGAVAAGTLRVTGTVTSIDPAARTATLRFADGSSQTFPVRPDIDLSKHAPGEQVVFQVTERIALDLRKE